MKKISPKEISRCSVVAALYAAVSVMLLPLSFGAIQVRVAEALTVLPVLTPRGVWGVTLGCIITNAYGVATGANILGAADIIIGSVATFSAAVLTRLLRRFEIKGLPVLATVPPVLINAVIIGAEITFAETGTISSPLLIFNMLYVGAGQLLSCSVLGLLLFWSIKRTGLDKILF